VSDLFTIQAAPRWWLMPYLVALYWFADLMDTEPKSEHVEWIVEKGMRLILKPAEP
jgi:hypothetical protein